MVLAPLGYFHYPCANRPPGGLLKWTKSAITASCKADFGGGYRKKKNESLTVQET